MLKDITRQRPIVVFVLLTLFITYPMGLSWSKYTTDLESSLNLPDEFLSLGLMRAAPTIAGLLVVASISGRQGLRVWGSQLLRWKVHPGYYFAIVVMTLVPFLGSLELLFSPAVLANSPDLAATRDWGAIALSYLGEFVYISLTNGEETGWRFVLFGLLLLYMNPASASVAVGLIWAFWHLPAFFLFGQGALWFPLVLICLGWAALYGWLYIRTHSLLLTILAHGAANATFYTFEMQFGELSKLYDQAEPLGDWYFAAVGATLAIILVGLERRVFFTQYVPPPNEDWAAPARIFTGQRAPPRS